MTYSSGQYPQEYVPTVFDNYVKDVPLHNQQSVSLELWDTAGQESYDKLRPLSYPDTDIFLICYQTNNYESVQSVFQKWIPEITFFNPNTPFFLVGTKTDIVPFVSGQRARDISQRLLLSKADQCWECSAKTNTNVVNIFQNAVETGLKHRAKSIFMQTQHCCRLL